MARKVYSSTYDLGDPIDGTTILEVTTGNKRERQRITGIYWGLNDGCDGIRLMIGPGELAGVLFVEMEHVATTSVQELLLKLRQLSAREEQIP